MPITKTYLSNKSVAQVRAIANRKKIATKGKTKPQIISAILKHEAKKKTNIKASKPKTAYAYKKAGNKYILAAKSLTPGSKTVVKLVGMRDVNKADKMAREGKLKKMPFSMVMLKLK
tara:strand:+ start:200 stop:550 length:351 start_codon:yes stop_codon:yes gene_type:complete